MSNLDYFKTSPIIAIDFDDTIAENEWPDIGKPKEGVVEAINKLKDNGCRIAIWTCRNDKEDVKKAKDFLEEYNIPYDAFNSNDALTEDEWEFFEYNDSRKIGASFYIDDKGIEFKDNWPEIVKRILSVL